MTAFAQLIKALPELTTTERDSLAQRLKVLQSLPGAKEQPVNGKRDLDDRVLSILCQTLRDLGVEYPSFAILRRGNAYAAFNNKLPGVYKFLEQVGPDRIAQDALLKLALELLYTDLVSWQGVSISAMTMMSHIHRVPATVSKHFPGYAMCGMLPWIIKAKKA